MCKCKSSMICPILGLFFRSGTLISTLDVSSMTGIREGNVLRGIEFL